MLLALAAFGIAGLATGTAFLASYAAENGLPFEMPALSFPALSLPRFAFASPKPPGPTWCEATRRWRDPVTRSFVKAPR